MLRYPCLILDHDDTVVQSEATVNYPYFCQVLDQFRPGAKITIEEYTEGCYQTGFVEMCKQKFHFTDNELTEEYLGWKEYMKTHIPEPFSGIKDFLMQYKADGGIVCVVSLSTEETIARDYRVLMGFQPDAIYGWDLPEQFRKPNSYAVEQILSRYHLSPDQVLVVDDMKTGWEMAQKHKVPVAFAAWGRSMSSGIYREMTSICDHTFQTIDQLRHFIYRK